ncbi:uncharacterized protein METZ01_LOCUS387091, partial [marine metagenome]
MPAKNESTGIYAILVSSFPALRHLHQRSKSPNHHNSYRSSHDWHWK